jgi:septum formation protein
MLADLSDRRHQVLTAVAVNIDGKTITELSTTEVCFRAIAADEAAAYWQCGEPQGKAGAYAIQGRAGIFVRSISGSYSGVVGLPVYETANLLKRAGIDVAVLRDEQNTE